MGRFGYKVRTPFVREVIGRIHVNLVFAGDTGTGFSHCVLMTIGDDLHPAHHTVRALSMIRSILVRTF